MIPVSSVTLESQVKIEVQNVSEHWQKQLANSFRQVTDLLDHLEISADDLPYAVDLSPDFRTKVTRHFADLIDASNPFDPLLLQVLPLAEEKRQVSGFTMDPLEEKAFSPLPGLIHKYRNRVLVIAHQACAIHCRYCFRRHFPYNTSSLSKGSLSDIQQYILEHPEINEVILSGGDPLSLSDSAFAEIVENINQLKQITTLRIHSRTPVLLPDRITTDFINTLKASRCKPVMVIHCNHPNELSPELKQKLKQMTESGVTLLNQSVLLKNINDQADILTLLSEQLFAAGVMPYYLHLLDPIAGAHHFQVSEIEAQTIWRQMQQQLSGYLLPKLVQEIPSQHSKTWKNPSSDGNFS